MTPPFDDSTVLYRFTPTEEERKFNDLTWGPADEYVVTTTAAWGRYNDHWRLLAYSPFPIIAHLLTERAALIQQRDYEWERRKQASAARQKAEAEREVYRDALEKFSTGKYSEGLYAERALKQGKKLREGE
jgi:hypothetical protein